MTACGVGMVEHGGVRSLEIMLGSMEPGRVFTRGERIRSGRGRTLQHWAGRLAAKQAVIRLIGVPATEEWMHQAEVAPAPTPLCRGDHRCFHGHPPALIMGPDLEIEAALAGVRDVALSITHTDTTALAVAVAELRAPALTGEGWPS